MFSWLKNLFSKKSDDLSLNIDFAKVGGTEPDTLPCDTEICGDTVVGNCISVTDADLFSSYYDPEPVKPKRTRKKSAAKKSFTKKSTKKSPRNKKSTKK